MRKRDARWASATERAKVAAQLLEEAQALSEECAIASPAEVARSHLPAPLHAACRALTGARSRPRVTCRRRPRHRDAPPIVRFAAAAQAS